MPEFFEFEVELLDIKPRIWRRFLIHKKATFEELHLAIQDACGWENYHLYVFCNRRYGDEIAGIPYDDACGGEPTPDARKIKLADYFDCGKPCKIVYEYDFGDSWQHALKLKKCVKLPESFKRRLLAGKRAFPPEDCGGIPGYEECLEALEYKENPDPDIDEYAKDELESRLEWLYGWAPEDFDLKAVKGAFDT